MKAKQLEAELAASLERERKGERFSLIEPPQLPEEPSKPNRLAILFLGFVFSFAGGMGNVAVREGMDQAVRGVKSVVMLTKAPPLAVIPVIQTASDRRRRSMRRVFFLLLLIIFIVGGLAAIHFFYKPLDVLWYIVLRKMELELGV